MKFYFYHFYSAEELERGVKLCMKVQRAVVRQSTAVLEKKAVRVIKNFRTVVMRDGPDLPLFQHPLTLSKLALFLTDAYRVMYLNTKNVFIDNDNNNIF